MSENSDTSDSGKLAGLFRFAAGILTARSKTRLRVDNEKLGCFREQELQSIPGLSIATNLTAASSQTESTLPTKQPLTDDAWLQLLRLRPGKPPLPDNDAELLTWLDPDTIKAPHNHPQLLPMQVHETTQAEAKQLIASGVLAADGVEVLEPVEPGEPGQNNKPEDNNNPEQSKQPATNEVNEAPTRQGAIVKSGVCRLNQAAF